MPGPTRCRLVPTGARVGRSRPFWEHFFPLARQVFPEALHDVTLADFHAAVNHVERSLNRFERTCHFLGNMLIDVDLSHDVARSETYAVAFHRYTDPDGYPTDMWAGLRFRQPVG